MSNHNAVCVRSRANRNAGKLLQPAGCRSQSNVCNTDLSCAEHRPLLAEQRPCRTRRTWDAPLPFVPQFRGRHLLNGCPTMLSSLLCPNSGCTARSSLSEPVCRAPVDHRAATTVTLNPCGKVCLSGASKRETIVMRQPYDWTHEWPPHPLPPMSQIRYGFAHILFDWLAQGSRHE